MRFSPPYLSESKRFLINKHKSHIKFLHNLNTLPSFVVTVM